MLTKIRAQSTVEYTALAIFIMVGILFMGPYVVRAVNSHFQGLEDQAEDSIEETFTQSPPLNLGLPNCDCSPLQFCRCGTGDAGDCDQQEELWCVTCDPPGCGLEIEECRPNPMVNWAITDKCCSDWECTGDIADCPLCPPNEGIQDRECGEESILETRCGDCIDCAFLCNGGPSICADEDVCGDDPPLFGTDNWTHVDYGNCSPPGPPECEAECYEHLIATPGGCDCPPPLILNGTCGCDCPPPTVEQDISDTCGGGWCNHHGGNTPAQTTWFQFREFCPPDYLVTGGQCSWSSSWGADAPHWILTHAGGARGGPTADGNGWQCLGKAGWTSGSTCHSADIRTRAFCEYDCPSGPPVVGPQGVAVFQEDPGCGNDITTDNWCYTEACDAGTPSLRYWNCARTACNHTSIYQGEQCSLSGQKIGELAYGLEVGVDGVDVLMNRSGCMWDSFSIGCGGFGSGTQRYASHHELTWRLNCWTDQCHCCGCSDCFYNCDGDAGHSQKNCANWRTGQLYASSPPGGHIELFAEPAGCGGNLTQDGSGCETIACDIEAGPVRLIYHDCDGSCPTGAGENPSPQNCGPGWLTSYGYLPTNFP